MKKIISWSFVIVGIWVCIMSEKIAPFLAKAPFIVLLIIAFVPVVLTMVCYVRQTWTRILLWVILINLVLSTAIAADFFFMVCEGLIASITSVFAGAIYAVSGFSMILANSSSEPQKSV